MDWEALETKRQGLRQPRDPVFVNPNNKRLLGKGTVAGRERRDGN